MIKKYTALYFLLPLLLFILQAIYTFNSFNQIRYEELANAIRNPFWLSQGLVYDGVSTSVGWDGTILIIYNLFGFNLFTGKFFRLFLSLISFFCLSLILKKYLGEKWAWLPLLLIGLSPTLLFYTTLQAQYAIDLQYLPIVIYLLINSRWWINLIGVFISMIAWLSYPPFMFYLPLLVWLYIKNNQGVKKISSALVAFIFPFIIPYLYISNKEIFLNDTNTGGGVFRGAGNFSLDSFSSNLVGLFSDLFIKGKSYHFEVYLAEFSLIFPIISLAFLVYGLWEVIKLKKWRMLIILSLVSAVAVVVLSSLTLDPSGFPGIRRYTPVLVGFYALLIIVWQSGVLKKWGMVVLGLLLIHHLIVYPVNLIHLKDPSPSKEPLWFSRLETPQKSLDSLVETVQKEDLKLVCMDEKKNPVYCRLSEVYAAVAGSCQWNHLDCHQILGYDFKSNQLIPLNVGLWDSYYFEH